MLREILVSGLREYLAGIRIGLPVTALAKWKTGFQMGALGTLLAGDSGAAVLHLGFSAGLHHRRGHALGRRHPDAGDGMGLPDGRPAPRPGRAAAGRQLPGAREAER